MSLTDALPPGSRIGMLGGGQLGRMAAMAAARLGYLVHVYSPEPDGPCAQVCALETVGDWDHPGALHRFAQQVDVITLEFENVPLEAVQKLAAKKPVFPRPNALSVAQDRIAEKTFLARHDIPVPRWMPIHGRHDIAIATREFPLPGILKTNRLGYDGKGQMRVLAGLTLDAAWQKLGKVACILEAEVAFEMEISVVLARGRDGDIRAYPPVENRHRKGILAKTIAPAGLAPRRIVEAQEIARRIAEALDYVGVLAVEMFMTREGRLLVNEIAPRPHNSGHWTLDACITSQFEQQIRATVGLPLGDPRPRFAATMRNLIGDDAARWQQFATDPQARLHLYGKAESRPGRKMGHVTYLRALRQG